MSEYVFSVKEELHVYVAVILFHLCDILTGATLAPIYVKFSFHCAAGML